MVSDNDVKVFVNFLRRNINEQVEEMKITHINKVVNEIEEEKNEELLV